MKCVNEVLTFAAAGGRFCVRGMGVLLAHVPEKHARESGGGRWFSDKDMRHSK